MDMKYDSSVMHQLTDATERRIAEAYNDFERVRYSYDRISRSDWDDEKRKELEEALDGIKLSLMASVRELQGYLEHLRGKMREFENRG